MKRLCYQSILKRVEGRRIVGLWYGVEDGYVRLKLDDGSVLLVAASWEGCHVVVDPAVTCHEEGAAREPLISRRRLARKLEPPHPPPPGGPACS